MYNSTDLAAKIKAIAKLKQISIKDMLIEIQLGSNTMSALYHGKSIAFDSLAKIADYLDVPLDYLVGRGLFENWNEIIQNKENIIAIMELSFDFIKDLDLLNKSEDLLIKILPAFISKIKIEDNNIKILYHM